MQVTDAEVSGLGHVGVGQEEHLLRQRDVTGDDNGSHSLLQANGKRNGIAKPLQSQVRPVASHIIAHGTNSGYGLPDLSGAGEGFKEGTGEGLGGVEP